MIWAWVWFTVCVLEAITIIMVLGITRHQLRSGSTLLRDATRCVNSSASTMNKQRVCIEEMQDELTQLRERGGA